MSDFRFSPTQPAADDAGCGALFALMVSACTLAGGIAASQIRAAWRRRAGHRSVPAVSRRLGGLDR